MTAKKEAEQKQQEETPLPSLSTLTGSGDYFYVGNKKYKIKPLKLKVVDEFSNDGVNIGPQMFSVVNKESRAKLDKWLPRQVFDANDEPLTLERAIEDDWDLTDLRKCVQMMLDISG